MTDYNFAAQYQQNPQPPSGIIVKREWFKFYTPAEKPKEFSRVIQSWDTASKETELANYSVCTTWGFKDYRMYLLDVFRRKLDFPSLKRAVKDQISLHAPTVVLIEDKASGISLIQELRHEGFSKVQAAPAMDGDKIMRLRAQTAQIEGGFVLLPKEAAWLDKYIRELISFPNSKNDDQVDSTVFALAWVGQNRSNYGWTDKSLAALERVSGDTVYGQLMARLGRPPY
jgi:predicted phage terminase large subunit-like protein